MRLGMEGGEWMSFRVEAVVLELVSKRYTLSSTTTNLFVVSMPLS
jgi:hypothetical protein